jgi:hypothetical protein
LPGARTGKASGRSLLALAPRGLYDGTPALTTDKEAYAPGEPITFNGTNWTPGETVTIVISGDASGANAATLQATADVAGSFTVTGLMPESASAGVASAAAKGAARSAAATIVENTTYTVTATGANSGVEAQARISTVQATVNVPTPGCGAVLTPDVVDFLRSKGNDPVEDYEAWRRQHPNMVELPMPLQCRSEGWRVLHGLMEEPATQTPESTSAASSPFVGDAVTGPDADTGLTSAPPGTPA